MRGFTTQFIRQLSTASNHRTDGELLDGFLTHNADADFAELVGRYGAMVWAVCRRALPDRADAEDAFQTAFLVLVRRGNKLVGHPTVGPWLHRVAVWTCRNIRRRNAHRLSKRETLSEAIPVSATDRDLPLDLDNALLALPEKFRSSIVLCHLLGFSRADAAAQLGCPEGTLSAWLSRGMAKLRAKLSDLDPARLLGITALAVPAGLSASVVRAAVACHTTAVITAGMSSAIPQLVEGVIRMLWIKKATAASVSLFAMFAFGVGVGVSTFQVAPAADGQENPAIGKTAAPSKMPQALQDPVELSDPVEILNRLELQLLKAENDNQKAMERVKVAEEKVVQNAKGVVLGKLDKKQLEKALDDLALEQSQAKEIAWFRNKVKDAVTQVKETMSKSVKAKVDEKATHENPVPKNVEATAQPSVLNDLDKKIVELQQQRVVLQIKLKTEFLNSRLSESALRTELKEIDDQIEILVKQNGLNQKNPTAANARNGYFQLSVETKDTAWPFVIREYGLDGKLIGKTAFDNSEALGRFLARAMKDSTAPKEVRITAQNNTPIEMLSSAIEACRTAGVAQNYIENENPKKRLAEWFDSPEKPTNAAEKEKNYPHAINDLFSKKIRDAQKLQQQAETEKNNRDAARKAIEWFQKRMANEPPNQPKP